jgi:hypothetical protein
MAAVFVCQSQEEPTGATGLEPATSGVTVALRDLTSFLETSN